MAHELSSAALSEAAQKTTERQSSRTRPKNRGDKRGPGRGAPPARQSGPDSTPKFKTSYFVKNHEATSHEISGMTGKETQKTPEYVAFDNKTKQEMTTFLDTYVDNISEVYNAPGGRDILNSQPHAKELLSVLLRDKDGGRVALDGTEASGKKVRENIAQVLETPEGWVLAKTLLDQQTALQMFAAGFQISSLPQGEREAMAKELSGYYDKMYLGGEGSLHKGTRKTLEAIKPFWNKKYAALAGGSATAGLIAGGVGNPVTGGLAAVAVPLLASLGERGFKSLKQEGVTVERKMFVDGLQTIQRDKELAAYIKATTHIDVEDFIIDGETIKQNPHHEQSTANPRELVDQIFSNSITRMRYFDTLGVPPTDRDIMPEQFIFLESNGKYERTGERVNKMIIDRFNKLKEDHVPNTESLPPFDSQNFIQDIWGQTPDNPFYGRMDGKEEKGSIIDRLRGKEFPPPFDAKNVTWEKTDQWGNKEGDAFYGREEKPQYDPSTIESVQRDIWGQKKDNSFYGILDINQLRDTHGNRVTIPNRESRNIPPTQPDLSNPQDIWGQTENYPDGTRNPFFGRANANEYMYENPTPDGTPPTLVPAVMKRDSQGNIERDLRDKWGQQSDNPLYGRRDGDRYPLENFDNTNILPNRDKWGQTIDNPFFGRMEFNIPPINKENFRARDEVDTAPNDPMFGLRFRGHQELDYGFFANDNPNRARGLDRWGRPPSDPLFCCDKDFVYPIDNDDLRVDQWGQKKENDDGTLNPYFGTIDKEKAMVQENLTMYRKARELVLAELTEKLIDRMGANPKKSVSLIDEQIKALTEDGGRILEKRREAATEEKDRLETVKEITEGNREVIESYDQELKKGARAEKELPLFISEVFGPSVRTSEGARLEIDKVLNQDGRVTITIDGRSKTIPSIMERRLKAARVLNEEQQRVYENNPMRGETDQMGRFHTTESQENYDGRIGPLLQIAERKYQNEIDKAEEDARTLLQVQAEIEGRENEIKTAKEAEKSEANTERDLAIYSPSQEELDRAVTIAKQIATLPRNASMKEILEKIHELGEDDGWTEDEDGDPLNQARMVYALNLTHALRERRSADAITTMVEDSEIRQILDQTNVSLGMLERLSLDELKTELGSFTFSGATTPEAIDAAIQAAKDKVETFANTMKGAIIMTDVGITRQIARTQAKIERESDFTEEVADRKVIKEGMVRQGKILGNRTEFMADINTYIPVKSDGEAQIFDGLSPTERARYTQEERKVAENATQKRTDYLKTVEDEYNHELTDPYVDMRRAEQERDEKRKNAPEGVPVGYYELMNLIFDYKSKPNREEYFQRIQRVLPPDRLMEVFQEVKAANPDMQIDGNNLNKALASLNKGIRNLQITSRDLRKIFVSLIDSVEGRALADNFALAS